MLGSLFRSLSTKISKEITRRKVIAMEGIVATESGAHTSILSPSKLESNLNASGKSRTQFTGISPLAKQLKYISSPKDKVFKVSIEGNIGAGKSTLIDYFSSYPEIETYPEPIEWWRNCQGHNLLELLYKDINKWHTTFQTYVQLTRLKVQTQNPQRSSTTVQMFERSVQNNRFCFVEQAYTNGYLNDIDYDILDKHYRWIRQTIDINLDFIVYLRTSPEIAFERTMARNRSEESSITLEYLQQLHESHERWLMTGNERFNTTPVLVLDGDKTFPEIVQEFKRHESQILGHDKKGKPVVSNAERDKVKRVLNTNF